MIEFANQTVRITEQKGNPQNGVGLVDHRSMVDNQHGRHVGDMWEKEERTVLARMITSFKSKPRSHVWRKYMGHVWLAKKSHAIVLSNKKCKTRVALARFFPRWDYRNLNCATIDSFGCMYITLFDKFKMFLGFLFKVFLWKILLSLSRGKMLRRI